jgi:mannose-1-phosphate guanylyltransferase/mannose-6-phosphate isomerase
MSSEQRPKQFLALVTNRTLLQETLLRARQLQGEICAPLIVCNAAHAASVAEQASAVGVEPQLIVLEPVARNTAPAVAVAALTAVSRSAGGEGTLLLVLPADHVIPDTKAFASAVATGIEAAAEGYLVTFGVVPTAPETGYGYIHTGDDRGRWSLVERFVEKPDRRTAESYLRSGRYLWNSGMFLFSAEAFLTELREHAAETLVASELATRSAVVEGNVMRLGAAFHDCNSISVDYAVMERTRRAAVVPLAAGWSDVGSWGALYAMLDKDSAGNVRVGDVLADACTNSYFAASTRVIVAIGLEDVVVVETADAVLVMSRTSADRLKDVVGTLKTMPRDAGDRSAY